MCRSHQLSFRSTFRFPLNRFAILSIFNSVMVYQECGIQKHLLPDGIMGLIKKNQINKDLYAASSLIAAENIKE
ncbi:hypothetical protein CUU66_09735 [Peribacillus deserti]|uniref:Uncharacterized protein n=1 Tax=Peribacillus deserti TaxID=673318 RepID=A0A2N5M6U5_9BACI|nr:hypothetical protein CUU66_09735 [Peribacillus deserti]